LQSLPKLKLNSTLNIVLKQHYTTDLYPDIVWWDDQQKFLIVAELTISYETNLRQMQKEGTRIWKLSL